MRDGVARRHTHLTCVWHGGGLEQSKKQERATSCFLRYSVVDLELDVAPTFCARFRTTAYNYKGGRLLPRRFLFTISDLTLDTSYHLSVQPRGTIWVSILGCAEVVRHSASCLPCRVRGPRDWFCHDDSIVLVASAFFAAMSS